MEAKMKAGSNGKVHFILKAEEFPLESLHFYCVEANFPITDFPST